MVNRLGEIIESYRPEKLNNNIFPQVLRIMVHNSHCYELDASAKNKLDKLRAKFLNKNKQKNEISTLTVSNNFYLRKPVLDDCAVHFVNKIDDCVTIAKSIIEDTKVRFITNTELLDMLFQMISVRYTPNVKFSGNRILSLGFSVGKVKASIENTDNTTPDDVQTEIYDIKSYKEFHKANDRFYSEIFRESLKSEYPKSVLDVEDKYPMGPTSGYLTKKFDEDVAYNAIDTVRAYTDCLCKIDTVPVYGYFDIYTAYDNHDIEDFTIYRGVRTKHRRCTIVSYSTLTLLRLSD